MIYVLTEIKGYVVAVVESPPTTTFDLVNVRKDFMSLYDNHQTKKPVWVPNHNPAENRHEEYKLYQAKVRAWDAEGIRILETLCKGEKDTTEAFVNYLVSDLGFKRHEPYEQIELTA